MASWSSGCMRSGNHIRRTMPAMGPLVLPAFLDPILCRRVRAAMDRGARESAEIAGEAISERHEVRNALGIDVEPMVLSELEHRIEDARPAIERRLGHRLGEREGTGLLRYPPGGFYLPHRDRGSVAGWPAAARRAASVIVF